MSNQQHIIGKQIVELQMGSREDAFAVQQEVSFTLRNQILPRLEDMFDRLVDENILIRLDQLEIDVGRLDPQRISYSLVEQLLPALERALIDKIAEIRINQAQPGDKTMAVSTSVKDVLISFLEKGYFPWYARIKDWHAWEKEVVETMQKAPSIAGEVVSLLKRFPHILPRVLGQFSPDFKKLLIQQATHSHSPKNRELIESLKEYLPAIIGKPLPPDFLEKMLPDLQIRFLVSQENSEIGIYLVRELIRQLAKKSSEPYRELLSKANEWVLTSPDTTDKEFEDILIKLWREETGVTQESDKSRNVHLPESGNQEDKRAIESGERKDNDEMVKRDRNEAEILKEKSRAEPETISEQRDQLRDNEPAEQRINLHGEKAPEQKPLENVPVGEEIFIGNAGLVIVHAYLPTLFKALDYLSGNDFKDESSRHRAVHLLQYVASGQFGHHEPDLVLNKFLCGLPLNSPVGMGIILTDEEKAESEKLLQAIIAHWKALKNTTPDGLRVNFFLREGKLSHTENGWKLQVEQKTMDILLGKLPWSISLIKHPWMPDMLRVDWV